MNRLRQYLSKTPPEKVKEETVAYLAALEQVNKVSPLISEKILQELKDQRSNLKLIASENFSSLSTQLAMGNLLTDKYAEGHPFHRFYAGCDNVDIIEQAAVDELKSIFKADHAYVQPHSGADANLVALWAILVYRIQNPEMEKLSKKNLVDLTPEEFEKIRQLMLNQKMMGMSLNSGGHLTHGYRPNVSAKMFRSTLYDVDPSTELLDYSQLAEQVKQVKPAVLMAGYSSYPRKLNFAKMREIADSVGATFMVDMAHFAGLVAGHAFEGDYNPIPFAHLVTSTTHKTLRGPRGGIVMCKQEFTDIVNKGCPLVLGGPLPHVMAAKAVAFKEVNTPEFKKYASQIVKNAQTLAEELKQKGIRLVTGGTDNHLMVLDLSSFGITGKQAESILREANLTVNRNVIPFDKNSTWDTSGIRLGTPALTTLGMAEPEMKEIASIIFDIISHIKPSLNNKTGQLSKAQATIDPEVLDRSKKRVSDLLHKYPLYPEIEIDN